MATEQVHAEVKSLERVLTRLGLTEDDRLEEVLSKLFPVVLKKIDDNGDAAVQKAGMNILSFVNKRMAPLPNMQLPMEKLITLFHDSKKTLVRNLALLYIERGIQRCPRQDRMLFFNLLLENISDISKDQQCILLRAAVMCLEQLGTEVLEASNSSSLSSFLMSEDPKLSTIPNENDRKAFLKYALLLMLYAPSLIGQPTQISGNTANHNTSVNNRKMFGLSMQDVKAVEGLAAPDAESIVLRKLGVLAFSARRIEDPVETLNLYLVASEDSSSSVSMTGEELFKRRCAFTGSHPPINIESPVAILTLWNLFSGNYENDVTQRSIMTCSSDKKDSSGIAETRSAPSSSICFRIMSMLCRSVTAANLLSHKVPVIVEMLFVKKESSGLFDGGSREERTPCKSFRDRFVSVLSPSLRPKLMEFVQWSLLHMEISNLIKVSREIIAFLDGLKLISMSSIDLKVAGPLKKELLEHSSDSVDLDRFIYNIIGIVSQRDPTQLNSRVDIAVRCFYGLANDPPGLRASAAEATFALAGAFSSKVHDDKRLIELDENGLIGQSDSFLSFVSDITALLENCILNGEEAVRVAALRWSKTVFPFEYVPARYLCIIASGDNEWQIREAALSGLQPVSRRVEKAEPDPNSSRQADLLDPSNLKKLYPSFSKMLEYLLERHPYLIYRDNRILGSNLTSDSIIAAINFLEACRLQTRALREVGNSNAEDRLLNQYFSFLENVLVPEYPSELHALALSALLSVSKSSPELFSSRFLGKTGTFISSLSSINRNVRMTSSRVIAILSHYMSDEEIYGTANENLLVLSAHMARMRGDNSAKKLRFEELDGRITVLGLIASQIAANRQPLKGTSTQSAQLLVNLVSTVDLDMEIRASAAKALGHVALSTHLIDLISHDEIERILDVMGSMIDNKSPPRVVKCVIQSLGFMARGLRADKLLTKITDILLELHSIKDRTCVQMAGESLAFVFGGVSIRKEEILWSSFDTLEDWWSRNERRLQKNVDESLPDSSKEPEEKHSSLANQEYSAESSNGNADFFSEDSVIDANIHQEHQENAEKKENRKNIFSFIFDSLLRSVRPESRFAGATWLVALISYCGKARVEIQDNIQRIHEAFASLLADNNDATQELASRGISLAYDLADSSVQDQLVSSLMDMIVGAPGRKRRAADISPESKVFEPGALGDSSNQSGLSTYREICQLATDLGQPDLIYKFMQIANADAAVNASRGAAMGFASVAKIARGSISDRIDILIPRLYRSLYDPQAKVRDAMHHIWVSLIDEPNECISMHFGPIMGSLLKDMTGSQWRIRESAAAAAADAIQGRRWEEIQPYFEKLWSVSFRVVDDVKETVRQAGFKLVRALRGLTFRLSDAEVTPHQERRDALSAALPVLLQVGLLSQVTEIQAITVDTIAKMVASAGPEVLRLHMKKLVPALIESLSGLEDSRLNYIEQHAGRLGIDTDNFDAARVNSANKSAIGESIETCVRAIDGSTFADLCPELSGIIRRGTGVATRAGAARFVMHVTHRLRSEVGEAAPLILKSLKEACFSEQSPAVRKGYASSLATVLPYAPNDTVDRIMSFYLRKATSEDASLKEEKIVGVVLKSISRESPDIFDEWSRKLVPIAFILRFNPETEVSEVWEEVWNECSSAPGSSLGLHLNIVLERAIQYLRSSSWAKKRSGAAAIAAAANTVNSDIWKPFSINVAKTLLEVLPGRLWDGKEHVLRALGATVIASKGPIIEENSSLDIADETDIETVLPEILDAFILAAGKKKLIYRRQALQELSHVLEKPWSRTQIVSLVEKKLLMILDDLIDLNSLDFIKSSAPHQSSTDSDDKLKDAPIVEVLQCLGAMWGSTNQVAMNADRIVSIYNKLAAILEISNQHKNHASVISACRSLINGNVWPDYFKSPVKNEDPKLIAASTSFKQLFALVCQICEDSKVSSLREQSAYLLKDLMCTCHSQIICDDQDVSKWKHRLQDMVKRERVPAVVKVLESAMAQV